MKTILHKAGSRGNANHGWLNSQHTFSFAGYHNPERMHFGVLRVLNDDVVKGGKGFGAHPHDNMEIISIPISGSLEHNDSMGNTHVIKAGEIQVMSAGKGITHAEYNHDKNEEVNFLQIWVYPRERNVEPRYAQAAINPDNRRNELITILSPDKNGGPVWIHQDAWFSMGWLDRNTEATYKWNKKENGLYVFIIEGSAEIGGIRLEKRDGLGITDTSEILIRSTGDTQLLLMEIPMELPR